MLLNRFKNAAVALLLVLAITAGAGAVISRAFPGQPSEKEKTVKDAEKAVKNAEAALTQARKALQTARETADKRAASTRPEKGEAKVKTRWEYKSLSHDEIKALEFRKRGTDTAEGGLNMLGEEGWELVAIEPAVYSAGLRLPERAALYVFKRPKR